MNKNLPDFMVLNSAFWSGDQRNVQALYSRLWGSGFLPSKHQGVMLPAVRRSGAVSVQSGGRQPPSVASRCWIWSRS